MCRIPYQYLVENFNHHFIDLNNREVINNCLLDFLIRKNDELIGEISLNSYIRNSHKDELSYWIS